MIIDNGNKYINFQLLENKPKTQRWLVINKSSAEPIACLEWYPAWRQYTFFPEPDTVFNNGCIESILQFLNRLNKEKIITHY